jgi:hypothetical protein
MARRRRRRRRTKTKFQLQLKALGFKTYEAYLKSDHWKEFKEAYYTTRQKVCYCCSKPARDLHHTSYANLGHEKPSEVVPLCRDCHDKVHTIIRENKVPLGEAHEVVTFIMNG